ncbi:hypothetical protein ACJQWK_11661 [Exserohilum turcicum]
MRYDTAPPYFLYNADVFSVKHITATGALGVDSKTLAKANICLYDASSGLTVVPPGANFHVLMSNITSLIGADIPPATTLTNEFLLPGCGDTSSQDCLVSRAVNGMSSDCVSNPHLQKCMLALVPAFCFDVPARRLGMNASAEVEACFRRVQLGPCVANPSGAACLSGKFAGIVQFVSGSGGSVSSRSLDTTEGLARRQLLDPLFAGIPGVRSAIDEFWTGVMKNIINSGISLVNFFRDGMVASSRANCIGASLLVQDKTAAASIRQGCSDAFKEHTLIAPLPLNSDIERAGNIFAEIVSLLWVVGDIAKAAKAAEFVGFMDAVMAKFKPKAWGTKGGSVLEATEGSNTVQIFNNYGDGKAAPLFTDSAISEMEKTTSENTFLNCRECVGTVARRQVGSFLKRLCCFSGPRENPLEELGLGGGDIDDAFVQATVIQEAVGLSERTIGPTVELVTDATRLDVLKEGSDQWAKYYIANDPAYPKLDDVTRSFYDAVSKFYAEGRVRPSNRVPWARKIRDAATETYGFTNEEREAVIAWVGSESHSPQLESALGKMNPVQTWVTTTTPLTDEALKALKARGPGWQSKGPSGVYSIQDLFFPTLNEADAPDKAAALSASLGIFPVFEAGTTPYRFVIMSQSGRYIPPVYGSLYHEVLFMEPYAGKFELLGFQELNGGEAAKAAGGKPPFGVFYFREIDTPTFSTRQLTVPGIQFPGVSQ